MSTSKMKKDLIGVFIFFGICCFVNAEICSIYRDLPISTDSDLSWNSGPTPFYLKEECAISLGIELHFECNTVLFDVENIISVAGVELRNIRTDKLYSSDTYNFYDNGILNISFAENIPPGHYHLHLNCNVKNSSPFFSEWPVLTNFDDNNLEKSNSESVRIWLRRSALGHGKYLLENAQNLLRAFKEFTGTAYNENKFVKLDLFVMPKSSTSKHHRGDFIYVDEEIFVNEKNIATDNKEKLFFSIVKMMVDQAFKKYDLNKLIQNRIDYDFLKEYLIYHITDKAMNNWHLMDLLAYKHRSRYFEKEFSYNQSSFDLENHHAKGSFVVRLLAYVMRDYSFNNYLLGRNSTNNNTLTSNKIGIIDGDEKSIENLIKNWNNQTDQQIIMIERDYKANKAFVTQQAFKKAINATEKVLYWIPLNFASEDNPNFDDTTVTHWLDPKVNTTEIVTPPPEKWLICNKQQFGFYRVNYDEKNWKLIINYMNSENYKKIHVLNRAQLLDDAFVFAKFGQLNYSIAFDLAKYLEFETEYVPWATFWETMFHMLKHSSISSTRYFKPFKKMVLQFSDSLACKFMINPTAEPNDRMGRLTRRSFIKWRCFWGSPLSCKFSFYYLQDWLEDTLTHPILEDYLGDTMCSGIRIADNETWYQLLHKFQSNKNENILLALMCTPKYELLDELMKMLINGQLNEQNPSTFLVNIVQQSHNGLDAIIHFIENNQSAMREIKSSRFPNMIKIFFSVIEKFAINDQQLQKFKQIINNYLDILGQKEVDERSHYAELRVNSTKSLFRSMENYWKAQYYYYRFPSRLHTMKIKCDFN